MVSTLPRDDTVNREVGRGLSTGTSSPVSSLSPRQLEVLRLAALGLTYAEQAKRLGLSPETVKNYHVRIHDATGCPSLVDVLRHVGWLVVP